MFTPGTELGPYLVEAVIGRGGQGAVYRVYHRVLRRMDALKAIPVSDDAQGGRALREAAVLARLDHPNIVRIFTADIHHHHLCIFMELVHGVPLRDLLSQRRLEIEEALAIFRQIVAAVDHAHERGVIHRDLKPDNVLMVGGNPKVVDFGIAKCTSESGAVGQPTGNVALGTPSYMAPEQFMGSAVGHSADIYALGCILYEMVGGSIAFPFLGGSILPLIRNKEEGRYTPLGAGAQALPWVEHLVARCLEPNPEQRIQTCHDLLELLDGRVATNHGFLDGDKPTDSGREHSGSRHLLLLAALFSVLLVVCAGGSTSLILLAGENDLSDRASQVVEAPISSKVPVAEDSTLADPPDALPPTADPHEPARGLGNSSTQRRTVEPAAEPVEPQEKDAAPSPIIELPRKQERSILLVTCPLPSELKLLVNGADARDSGRLVGNRLRVKDGDVVTLHEDTPEGRTSRFVIYEGQSEIAGCFPGMESSTGCGTACAKGQL